VIAAANETPSGNICFSRIALVIGATRDGLERS
jgi:hypothetical protein